MGYRPRPNRDRALKQLDRHIDEVGPMLEPRPMTPFEGAAAALQAALPSARQFQSRLAEVLSQLPKLGKSTLVPVDEYRLSTRPGGVRPAP